MRYRRRKNIICNSAVIFNFVVDIIRARVPHQLGVILLLLGLANPCFLHISERLMKSINICPSVCLSVFLPYWYVFREGFKAPHAGDGSQEKLRKDDTAKFRRVTLHSSQFQYTYRMSVDYAATSAPRANQSFRSQRKHLQRASKKTVDRDRNGYGHLHTAEQARCCLDVRIIPSPDHMESTTSVIFATAPVFSTRT